MTTDYQLSHHPTIRLRNYMTFDFDTPVDRRGTESIKWRYYDPDVLPMWVADMDFRSPEPITRALRERAEHGVFGYAMTPPELPAVICEWLEKRFHWTIDPQWLVCLPGIVAALNAVCRIAGEPGAGVLVQTPVYPPFLGAPASNSRVLQSVELSLVKNDRIIEYEIDYDAFEAAITPQTRLFILCHPHNPIGRDYRPEELQRLAEICLRHDVLICSDEIHCDLLLGDTRHTPTASLSSEIADHCITLMAPSKTFNVPGLGFSFAVVPNRELRKKLVAVSEGVLSPVTVMGYTGALAAYREGGEWLDALRAYLTANRDAMASYIVENMPHIATTAPEATYLAWLDCRETKIEENPYTFFMREAKVALGNGQTFGQGGEGFVRLNFGCPQAQLMEALERMRNALGSIA
ncbi:MAG: PatB family C-S lyase [Anaerolineae bacterium]